MAMTSQSEKKQGITLKQLKSQKVLILLSIPFIIYVIIFCYVPLGGWLMAFQNYKPKNGLLHSEFVGLTKFEFLFSNDQFLKVIRNTLAMGVKQQQRDGNSLCHTAQRISFQQRKETGSDNFISAPLPFMGNCNRYRI